MLRGSQRLTLSARELCATGLLSVKILPSEGNEDSESPACESGGIIRAAKRERTAASIIEVRTSLTKPQTDNSPYSFSARRETGRQILTIAVFSRASGSHSGFRFLQDGYDLFFAKSTLAHDSSSDPGWVILNGEVTLPMD